LFIIILSAKVTRLMWQLCERLEPEEIWLLLSEVTLQQSDSSQCDKPEVLVRRSQAGPAVAILLTLDVDRNLCWGYGACSDTRGKSADDVSCEMSTRNGKKQWKNLVRPHRKEKMLITSVNLRGRVAQSV
jgi:hypothetical protein